MTDQDQHSPTSQGDRVRDAGRAAARILTALSRPDPGHEGQTFPESVVSTREGRIAAGVESPAPDREPAPYETRRTVDGPKPRGPMNGSPIINKLIGKIGKFHFKSGRELTGKLVTVDHQGWGWLDTSWGLDGQQYSHGAVVTINVRQAEVIE
jgi:hypothetical protein